MYGAVTLKNPHWPGWLTVANVLTLLILVKRIWFNLYRIWVQTNTGLFLPHQPTGYRGGRQID